MRSNGTLTSTHTHDTIRHAGRSRTRTALVAVSAGSLLGATVLGTVLASGPASAATTRASGIPAASRTPRPPASRAALPSRTFPVQSPAAPDGPGTRRASTLTLRATAPTCPGCASPVTSTSPPTM